MPKKAFLVEFAPRTRVIVDVPDGFDPDNVNFVRESDSAAYDAIICAAREKISRDTVNYLCGDNVSELEDDIECPFGTFDEDNK